MEEIYGYGKGELIGKPVSVLNPQPEMANEMVSTLIKTGSWEGEVAQIKKTKEIFPALLSLSTVKDEKGNPIAMMGAIRDITERKRAEEKIQQQNEFLSSMLDSLTHPFYVIDANDYTVKLANQAAKMGDLSENTTCHLLTHNSRQPCHGADHVCPLEEVKKTKKPAVVEHLHYDKDGNTRIVEIHGYPIFDSEGNVIQMIEYCLDITERKQSEWELVKTNQYLDAIFSSTREAIFTLTLKRHILTCNRAAVEMFGYPESAMLGKTTARFYPSRKAYLDTGKSLFPALEEKGFFSEELEMRRANGEVFPADVLTSILKLGEEPLGMVSVVRDVTERRRAEQQIFEYKELNRMKSNLLSTVSHEFRTPLATIKGYSSMLLDYDQRLERAEKLESLASIASTVDRLNELVERLLDMSRLESGMLELRKAPTSISKLVQQTAKESQLRAPAYRIVSRRDKRLPRVKLDAYRIRQVLDNLIENALKYSPEGTEVTIEARRAGPELLLKVTDQGIGIPTEELPTVFDRMYRIEQRTTAQAKGIGLGLAICRGLVEAHGGRIWAESTEGKGSTFTFTLPLKR